MVSAARAVGGARRRQTVHSLVFSWLGAAEQVQLQCVADHLDGRVGADVCREFLGELPQLAVQLVVAGWGR